SLSQNLTQITSILRSWDAFAAPGSRLALIFFGYLSESGIGYLTVETFLASGRPQRSELPGAPRAMTDDME
ncbi:MAG TPA: hypothetical protein VIE89_06070, partial [Candidatus Binatia bacterium]